MNYKFIRRVKKQLIHRIFAANSDLSKVKLSIKNWAE